MADNERHYSTTGRPRKLTDTQIAEILSWHRTKMNNIQMAARYGISSNTLRHSRTRRAELLAQNWL